MIDNLREPGPEDPHQAENEAALSRTGQPKRELSVIINRAAIKEMADGLALFFLPSLQVVVGRIASARVPKSDEQPCLCLPLYALPFYLEWQATVRPAKSVTTIQRSAARHCPGGFVDGRVSWLSIQDPVIAINIGSICTPCEHCVRCWLPPLCACLCACLCLAPCSVCPLFSPPPPAGQRCINFAPTNSNTNSASSTKKTSSAGINGPQVRHYTCRHAHQRLVARPTAVPSFSAPGSLILRCSGTGSNLVQNRVWAPL